MFRPVKPEEPAAEPAPTELAESNEDSTEHVSRHSDASSNPAQPQTVPQVGALKEVDATDPVRTSTPEFIKTITEVSESAALLDQPTPEPGTPNIGGGENEAQTSNGLLPNAANIAAEVADSAALLDRPTPELEGKVDAKDKDAAAPSEVAAEVADTAAKLDNEDDKEAPSEVAAQVADTAATLDDTEVSHSSYLELLIEQQNLCVWEHVADHSTQPETRLETASPTYKTLADVKADMKDESLEIAGFSNDHEPVPLFAHECAGLYADDGIPGVDEHGQSSSSGRDYGDDKEDYDDPTLERFPSTRDEIISTVRKVETGLNADQVSVEGVPLSPVVHARGSPTTEVRNESRASEQTPTSRGQQHLSLPPSLEATDERSRSTTSLHSIAEDAEGVESAEEEKPAEPQSEYIADVVEQSNGVDDSAKIDNKTITESSETSTADEIAPVVEQAETADEVIKVAQKAEGDQSKQIEISDAGLPAVVDSAPAAEDIVPVIETPSEIEDIASVVEQKNGADGAKSTQPDIAQVPGLESKNILHLDPAEAEKEVGLDSKNNDAEPNLAAQKPALESLVTVPSPSVKPDAALLSPVTDDDEAVVVKSTKGEEQSTKSGYLTPERAATPQPEEPGSPREPAPNTADPVAEPVLESSVPGAEVETPDVEAPLTQPRSPQIVVSKPKETRPEEELLPAASLGEAAEESVHADAGNEATKKDDSPGSEGNAQGLQEAGGTSQVPEPNGAHEESSKEVEVSSDIRSPGTIDDCQETGSLTENAATTSALEENQVPTLKKRSVARPDPVDRTGTPVSITDSHKEVAKGGNWFSAFLRLIFIDFFGGFVRKFTGGGRKT